MTGHDDDPYSPLDTRPFLGKTDRRESHRATLDVTIGVDDGEPDFTSKMVLSLSGLFMHKADAARDLDLKKIVVTAKDFDDEGDLIVDGIARRTTGGRGFVLPCDDVDFELSRRMARFLDTHTEEPA